MNRLEAIFAYGAWSVELRNLHGCSHAVHEWLIVALWIAYRRRPQRSPE